MLRTRWGLKMGLCIRGRGTSGRGGEEAGAGGSEGSDDSDKTDRSGSTSFDVDLYRD